jgi:hypothetical protein
MRAHGLLFSKKIKFDPFEQGVRLENPGFHRSRTTCLYLACTSPSQSSFVSYTDAKPLLMVSNEKCEENRFMSKMASVHASKSLRDANDGGILYTVATDLVQAK